VKRRYSSYIPSVNPWVACLGRESHHCKKNVRKDNATRYCKECYEDILANLAKVRKEKQVAL